MDLQLVYNAITHQADYRMDVKDEDGYNGLHAALTQAGLWNSESYDDAVAEILFLDQNKWKFLEDLRRYFEDRPDAKIAFQQH
jgi:hypothetical protein